MFEDFANDWFALIGRVRCPWPAVRIHESPAPWQDYINGSTDEILAESAVEVCEGGLPLRVKRVYEIMDYLKNWNPRVDRQRKVRRHKDIAGCVNPLG